LVSAGRALFEICKAEGVKYAIGVPGSAALPLFDDLYNMQGDITTILTKHEQTAGFIADGYARVTGVPCVTVATVGPGAMNLAAGMHCAYQDSFPVLAVTAQIATKQFGKGGVQEATGWGRTLSHTDAFKPVTKWSVLVERGDKLPEVAMRAFKIMLSGRRGPVHIDIPFDVQKAEVQSEAYSPEHYRSISGVAGDPALVSKAADLLLEAQSPAILAGGGVLASSASPELLELAEMLVMPVATSAMGKSCFPEDHPLSLGVAGVYAGHDVANNLLRKDSIDVLLAIGTIFHEVTTRGWSPDFGGRKIIQIDVDPEEIGKNYPIEIGVQGDARLVLRQLINVIKAKLTRPRSYKDSPRVHAIEEAKRDLCFYSPPQMFSDNVPVKPQRAIKELRDFLKRDAIVLADCGNNLAWTLGHFKTYVPRTFIADGGHTAMGFSAAAAIGVQLGAPGRQVVDVIGDGSFMMSNKEVGTARRYNIPVIWFVLNDGQLGMIKHTQKYLYDGRFIATDSAPSNPDYVKFADAFGVYGERVEKPGDVKGALKRAFDSGLPAILDITIDPNEVHPKLKARLEMFRQMK
jgi:acetolactate synthase-1/2/3 large subunit